ncbi:MAG: fibronectin type III domain-containing protein, partial [Amphritea sp.]|nr:fibronectin type III domain-containing protein [Amphritea sp.]
VINGTFKIHLNPNDKGLGMSLVIGGLLPYTNYTFEVVACTKVGCTASPLASTLTLQAPPEGVHAPNLTVTGAREIEATWIEPDVLNGVIVKYSLYRGNLLVYNGTDVCYKNSNGKDTCIFQDKANGLQPVTTYSYSVAATTGGGTTRSGVTTATTPESSPEAIPKPRLTVQSANSISAEWDVPGQPNGNITSYSVVVNGTEHNVGLNRSKLIRGLKPFTVYSVRVKACTAKGCGLGERE